MVSAIMQSVSGDNLAIALAREGGLSFIYGNQSVESEAEMIRKVKAYKAGFVESECNVSPDATIKDLLDLKAKTGHSTVVVTSDDLHKNAVLTLVSSVSITEGGAHDVLEKNKIKN